MPSAFLDGISLVFHLFLYILVSFLKILGFLFIAALLFLISNLHFITKCAAHLSFFMLGHPPLKFLS